MKIPLALSHDSELRTFWLASLGSALEIYDFIIFVFFPSVIGKLYFSPHSAGVRVPVSHVWHLCSWLSGTPARRCRYNALMHLRWLI